MLSGVATATAAEQDVLSLGYHDQLFLGAIARRIMKERYARNINSTDNWNNRQAMTRVVPPTNVSGTVVIVSNLADTRTVTTVSIK